MPAIFKHILSEESGERELNDLRYLVNNNLIEFKIDRISGLKYYDGEEVKSILNISSEEVKDLFFTLGLGVIAFQSTLLDNLVWYYDGLPHRLDGPVGIIAGIGYWNYRGDLVATTTNYRLTIKNRELWEKHFTKTPPVNNVISESFNIQSDVKIIEELLKDDLIEVHVDGVCGIKYINLEEFEQIFPEYDMDKFNYIVTLLDGKYGLYYNENTNSADHYEMQYHYNNELHRCDGPALFTPYIEIWYQNGNEHRENGPSTINLDDDELIWEIDGDIVATKISDDAIIDVHYRALWDKYFKNQHHPDDYQYRMPQLD